MEKIRANSVIRFKRVAIQIEDCERQRQRHGNCREHNQRFPKTQRERNQDTDRHDRDEHVP